MFSDFQSMFDKIKSGVNNVKQQVQQKQEDYANTPQKYFISGREIQQIKLLSQGAFGFIWLVEDVQTKEQFALKRVICMTEDRLRESKFQKQVMTIFPKSQFIVKYYGGDIISRNEQKVVITLMQLCDGGTLFDFLQKRQNKGFSEDELINITLSVAYGLNTIHQTGYYHRDVKIENILLGRDKKFKLCDFGSCTNEVFNFSQIHKREYDSIKQRIEGMTTPMYRSPEIVDPYLRYTVNSKADIWMLGCVLYTLSYFTHPFVDSNAIGISSGTYRFPKYQQETQYKVSDKIKDLIRHCLTPNPEYRPSAGELINLLKSWKSLSEVPLNRQAQKRKQEENVKQKELQKLHKKCVDYEGDIPLQKLMELQRKVKKTQVEDKPSTFIHKKGKQQNLINKPGVNNVKNNVQTNPFDVNQNKLVSRHFARQQQKKQLNFDNLWSNGLTNNNSTIINSSNNSSDKSNSFDFFNNLGSINNISVKPHKNSVNFEQMFAQTPILNSLSNLNLQTDKKKGENKNIDLIDL